MTEQDDRLQEHLEALEAGAPLDRVLTSAGDEDAALLRLASALRGVAHPAPARRAFPVVEHGLDRADARDNGSLHGTEESMRYAKREGLMSRLTAAGLFVALIALLIGAALLLPRLTGEEQPAGVGEATGTPGAAMAAPQPAAGPFPGWQWCGYDITPDEDAPGYELPPGRGDAFEGVRPGFWVAYPQAWSGPSGTCDRDRVAFVSPETQTQVRVWIRDDQGGPDWLENVKQRWGSIMMSTPPANLSSIQPNVRYLGREALFDCQPAHSGTGTLAALVFPQGDDLVEFHLIVGGGPPYSQAEADIFQTMLATFSFGPEPSVGDFVLPGGAWCESYEPVDSLWGRAGTVAASDEVIVLAEPARGFVTVSLAQGGELVNAAGQPVGWADVPPGVQIEAAGAAGDAGDYVAERIVVHGGPTGALSAAPAGLLFVLEESVNTSSIWLAGEGGEATRLHQLPERLTGNEFDVSPTGSEILFTQEGDIWRLDIATGQAANITQTADRREGYPRWLPDGSGFVCGSQPASSAGGPAPGHLTLVTFEGSYEVLDDTAYLAAPPALSPDGTTIAYSRAAQSAATGASFALYRFGGGVVEPETAGAPLRNVGELSWSPDGTRLAVADSSEGYAGVSWFEEDMRIPYGLEVYKPAGIGGALPAPVWQPGGERLALNILAAEAAESGLRFYAPDERGRYTRELFIPNTTPTQHPTFTPDGRRLAYLVGANEVYVVDMATYEISVWPAPGTVSAVGWAETGSVAPSDPPLDGLPADVADWDTYSLPDIGVTIPVPPGSKVSEWPVDDTVPFTASVSIDPAWEGAERCGYQCPEVSLTVWPLPAGETPREWLEAHSTAEPFGTTVDGDAEIYFFDVENVEETTLGGQPALAFTHTSMDIEVYTVIAEVEGSIVSLSKTHIGQFEFEPVFEMMRVHMQFGAD